MTEHFEKHWIKYAFGMVVIIGLIIYITAYIPHFGHSISDNNSDWGDFGTFFWGLGTMCFTVINIIVFYFIYQRLYRQQFLETYRKVLDKILYNLNNNMQHVALIDMMGVLGGINNNSAYSRSVRDNAGYLLYECDKYSKCKTPNKDYTSDFVSELVSFQLSLITNHSDENYKTTKNMKTKNIKSTIIWIASIGACVIALLLGLTIFLNVKYNLSNYAIPINICFSLFTLLVAILGIYIAYRIQKDIADMNTKNHNTQDFFNKLNVYMSSAEKLNQTYHLHVVNSHEKNEIIASANMLSTQAIFVYYALMDLIGSKDYIEKYNSNDSIKDSIKSIENILTRLSDIALIEMHGMDSFKSEIRQLVIQFNDENADFHREIHSVLYPKEEMPEPRTI